MELDYAQELEYRMFFFITINIISYHFISFHVISYQFISFHGGVCWITRLGTITKKYQNIDISEEELKERYEQEMKATYSIESDRVSAVRLMNVF